MHIIFSTSSLGFIVYAYKMYALCISIEKMSFYIRKYKINIVGTRVLASKHLRLYVSLTTIRES